MVFNQRFFVIKDFLRNLKKNMFILRLFKGFPRFSIDLFRVF